MSWVGGRCSEEKSPGWMTGDRRCRRLSCNYRSAAWTYMPPRIRRDQYLTDDDDDEITCVRSSRHHVTGLDFHPSTAAVIMPEMTYSAVEILSVGLTAPRWPATFRLVFVYTLFTGTELHKMCCWCDFKKLLIFTVFWPSYLVNSEVSIISRCRVSTSFYC